LGDLPSDQYDVHLIATKGITKNWLKYAREIINSAQEGPTREEMNNFVISRDDLCHNDNDNSGIMTIVVSGYSHGSSIATVSWLTNYIVIRLRDTKREEAILINIYLISIINFDCRPLERT
jgi:hypothetical protein